MQKLNFLPQVKIWNAAEFQSRKVWQNPDLGSFTYDGSANKFAVTLEDNNIPKWKYLLTSDSSTASAATTLKLKVDTNTYYNIEPDETGMLTVYTMSAYNGISNPMATLADVQSAVAGASILGLKMDSSIIHIDSSYIHLKSDASNPYMDGGDGDTTGENNVNPLATVATVRNAITNALEDLGDLFDLQGVYTNPYTPNQSTTITTFIDLLSYLTAQQPIPFNINKGTVLIFGNDEYVLIDTLNYSTPLGWEKLGSIDTNTAVISIGGESGTILLSDSFYMNSKTLTLNAASDVSLGGIKTGHTENAVNHDTRYEFSLRVGDSGNDTNRGYVSIPIVTGITDDASYGLVPSSVLAGGTHIYTVRLDPSSLFSVGLSYNEIKSVRINHNIGTDNLIISVYKLRATNTQNNGRQLIYVDEIIADSSSILIDFGSPEAFIGCQDEKNNTYLGYDVIIAASVNAIDITEDVSTSFVLNQTPEQFFAI